MKPEKRLPDGPNPMATSLRDIEAKERVAVGLGEGLKELSLRDRIPYGHKFAVMDISKGKEIIKYGEVIGRATQDIEAGEHAHIQNIESLRGRGDLDSGGQEHGV